jgi:predicted ATPase
LARAHAELGKFNDSWRCIAEAATAANTTRERWFDAEIDRIAGEIALKSPESDEAKAQTYFERALTIARQQQAKSWELRATMSLLPITLEATIRLISAGCSPGLSIIGDRSEMCSSQFSRL